MPLRLRFKAIKQRDSATVQAKLNNRNYNISVQMISQTNLKTKTPFTVSLFWKSKQLQREIIFPRFKTFVLSYFYRRLIINLYVSSTDLELHQNEPMICVFIVLCKNQSALYLCQGSPELFSPSVMRRREEFWGRD